MKEISRESLHSSIRAKPKEVQDKFLEVANTLIRKGSNTSYAIQEANKAIIQFEIDLEEKELAKQEEIAKQNRVKLEKALEGSVKLPSPVIQQEDNQVDPEEIESIYFDDEGKLIIRFGDGFIIKSKNIAPSKLIEERTAIAAQYPFFDWVLFNNESWKNNKPGHQEGLVFYDPNSHSLCYYNDNDNVTVNIGQEQILPVYNVSGEDILDGEVLYINGVHLRHPTVSKASNTSKTQAYGVIGVATTNIPNNTHGYVCVSGAVNGIDTSSYSPGQTLYLSNIAGQFTATRPLQPNYIVTVAEVTNVGTTDGSVNVRINREPWYPNFQAISTVPSENLPTVPTVVKPQTVIATDGFNYDSITGEIEFLESQNYTLTLQFNCLPSASNKNVYFYSEEYYAGTWTVNRYTARQLRLVNQIEDQFQITATRYVKTGTKFRFYLWGDATVSLRTTDLPGTTPGTVTLPAIRLSLA